MGLRTKFNIVLVGACLLGIGAATGLSYWVVQDSAIREVEQEITLLRSSASAVRSYTVSSVGPALAEDNDILFLPQSVTNYAAKSVFEIFRKDFPDYYYKEAALNPTNPADLPDAFEREMIERFRAEPALERIATVVDDERGRFFTVAFPITIKKQGCMRCHSTPDVAPPAMVDLYGPKNGFGWQMGETVGAQIVSAPMSLADDRARETVTVLAAALGLAFLLVLIVTNIMLSRIVLRPVARMSEVAEKVSMGDFSVPEYTKPGTDEISSLSSSFNRMRRSIESAMKLIHD